MSVKHFDSEDHSDEAPDVAAFAADAISPSAEAMAILGEYTLTPSMDRHSKKKSEVSI